MVVSPARANATGSGGFDNQVIPGQKEGTAQLIETLGLGAVAERKREVRDLVEEAFARQGRLWQEWRDNLTKVSQPDDAMRIAELILEEAAHVIRPPRTIKLFEDIPRRGSHPGPGLPGAASGSCSAVSTSTRTIPTAGCRCRR